MKNKMQFRKRYEQGLTLIEASMVLALSAVVVAGVMLYYQSASDNNKLQNAQGEFGSLQTIVQGVYAGKNGYAGVNTNLTVGSSAIPPNLQDSTTHTPLTPWQGAIALGNPTDQKGTGLAAAGAGDTSVYAIEWDNVPQGACTPLPTDEVSVIDAGEISGRLDKALGDVIFINLARKRIRAAIFGLIYPMVLVTATCFYLYIFGTEVVPAFTQVLPVDKWKADMLCFGNEHGLRAKIRGGKLEQLSTEIEAQRMRIARGLMPVDL